MVTMIFLRYRNFCGNDARNKYLYISNSDFFTSVYNTSNNFLCFAAKHKALLWKMETTRLLFLCTFYFILIRLLVGTELENIPFKFQIYLFV